MQVYNIRCLHIILDAFIEPINYSVGLKSGPQNLGTAETQRTQRKAEAGVRAWPDVDGSLESLTAAPLTLMSTKMENAK
jgi:hypothetical protein